nr:protein LURP-one-related 8 [Ipomoea trifida]
MTKVHPNASSAIPTALADEELPKPACHCLSSAPQPTVLTVWKKSLLFNCDGFTVFDDKGNLVYRVDNYYDSSNRAEIVLMDAPGNSLFTIRRKRLSLADNWVVYDGETADRPLYSVRKHVSLLNSKSLAHVTSLRGSGAKGSKNARIYEIEGSYSNRSCVMYDDVRRRVAEIKRKEAVAGGVIFGRDVFRLIVQPEIDSSVAMAMVILLEQMFGGGSSKRFSY